MINIDDYNFEEGTTNCADCTMREKCMDYSYAIKKFNQDVKDIFGNHYLSACMRFKITKKVKDETSNN